MCSILLPVLGGTEKFQGCVTVTLITLLAIRETINTNMCVFGLHSTIRHVVLGDSSHILPNILSPWSLVGTVSVDRLLRQWHMVDVVHVLTQKLLLSPSAQYQPWEREQLNVVQCHFLEQQKLTGSSLTVWSQSHLFVGLITHFPLPAFHVFWLTYD